MAQPAASRASSADLNQGAARQVHRRPQPQGVGDHGCLALKSGWRQDAAQVGPALQEPSLPRFDILAAMDALATDATDAPEARVARRSAESAPGPARVAEVPLLSVQSGGTHKLGRYTFHHRPRPDA
jgi:hypothetical protein